MLGEDYTQNEEGREVVWWGSNLSLILLVESQYFIWTYNQLILYLVIY